MKAYETLSEAVDDLQKQGYTDELKFKFDCLECESTKKSYGADDFQVDSFYRFEGMSDPDDNSVVYAISSNDGRKGMLIDAYGVYSDPISIELIEKLKMPNRSKK